MKHFSWLEALSFFFSLDPKRINIVIITDWRIMVGSCANDAPHGTLLNTMSVLHCSDTFHLRNSASLLLILFVSLFCLILLVSFFVFSLLFLWDSQWSVPLWCLHLFCAMQQLGTAALNMAGSLSQFSAGWPSKDRLRILNEPIHSKALYTECKHTHSYMLLVQVTLVDISLTCIHFESFTITLINKNRKRFWFEHVLNTVPGLEAHTQTYKRAMHNQCILFVHTDKHWHIYAYKIA